MLVLLSYTEGEIARMNAKITKDKFVMCARKDDISKMQCGFILLNVCRADFCSLAGF